MTERTPTSTGDPVPVAAPADSAVTVVDLAAQLDVLRNAAGRTAALAEVTLESYDHADWGGAAPALVEQTAYLLGMIAEAAHAVVAAAERFHGRVADRQRTGDSDEWW